MFGYNKNTHEVNLTHTVILGAGASIASFIHSGKIGKPLPSMAGLISTLGLEPEIRKFGIESWDEDFENFFSWLVDSKAYPELQVILEERIFEYFQSLSLPDSPTLYDYLILSLRKKDVIATFNWDPFLIQAIWRNQSVAAGRMPKIYFLHGNVLAGYCENCRVAGIAGKKCSKCKKAFANSPLLYPVGQKDYNSNAFLKSSWDSLKSAIDNSYLLTIFGYSAPKTDIEARKILNQFWTSSELKEYSEIEVVDIKPEKEVMQNWEEFFFSHHYRVHSDIFESMPFSDPRRSCEVFFANSMMCNACETNPFAEFKTIGELHEWIKPLIAEEIEVEAKRGKFSGFDQAE